LVAFTLRRGRVDDVQEFHARDNVLLDVGVDLARRVERFLGAAVGDAPAASIGPTPQGAISRSGCHSTG
jgi:hypothetical protein